MRWYDGMHPRLWAIVLAGGNGLRLHDVVRQVHGDDRPKQFASLDGGESLVRRTLRRLRAIVPPERTILVTRRVHDPFVREALEGVPSPYVFAQPDDRGTAVAILWPAQWVAANDPGAVLAVIPSDHFVADDFAFSEHIGRAAATAATGVVGRRTVLLGARPTSADPGYGWIELGSSFPGPDGDLFAVRSFVEKPAAPTAEACFWRGDLWNTMVTIAEAPVLAELAQRALPGVAAAMGPIAHIADGTTGAVLRAYASSPAADFSRDVLAKSPARLLVSRLPSISWADWGTPDRVIRSLAEAGVAAPWTEGAGRPAEGQSGDGDLRVLVSAS